MLGRETVSSSNRRHADLEFDSEDSENYRQLESDCDHVERIARTTSKSIRATRTFCHDSRSWAGIARAYARKDFSERQLLRSQQLTDHPIVSREQLVSSTRKQWPRQPQKLQPKIMDIFRKIKIARPSAAIAFRLVPERPERLSLGQTRDRPRRVWHCRRPLGGAGPRCWAMPTGRFCRQMASHLPDCCRTSPRRTHDRSSAAGTAGVRGR